MQDPIRSKPATGTGSGLENKINTNRNKGTKRLRIIVKVKPIFSYREGARR